MERCTLQSKPRGTGSEGGGTKQSWAGRAGRRDYPACPSPAHRSKMGQSNRAILSPPVANRVHLSLSLLPCTVCLCVCVCLVKFCLSLCVCVFVNMCIYMHVCVCIYVYFCVCVCVCVCVCLFRGRFASRLNQTN